MPHHQALRCSQCDFRTPFFAEMSRHMSGVHNSGKAVRPPPTPVLAAAPAAKRVAKPLPNLIPIQATPLGITRLAPPALSPSASPTPTAAHLNGQAKGAGEAAARVSSGTPVSAAAISPSGEDSPSAAETTKKKNSFFDQLRLYPGSPSDPDTLVCGQCGHEAKCMSELVRHNKLHQGRAQSTSTRCQYCRHRCKTSSGLSQHLKTCAKAVAAGVGAGDGESQPMEVEGEHTVSGKGFTVHMPEDENTRTTIDSEGTAESDMGPTEKAEASALAMASVDGEEDEADAPGPTDDDSVPSADATLVGVETAPGYGLVTTESEYEARAAKENVVTTVVNVKKVREFPIGVG